MRFYYLCLILLLFAIGTLPAQECSAAIYKYVDKDGTVGFASDLQSVPEKYRSSAQMVSGELEKEIKEGEKKPARENMAATTAVPNQVQGSTVDESNKRGPLANRFLISIIVIVSAVFVLITLRIIAGNNKRTVAVARMVTLWGVLVYLIYAHTSDVLTFFHATASSVENTQKQAEAKGRKAASMIKAFNSLLDKAEENTLKPSPEEKTEK